MIETVDVTPLVVGMRQLRRARSGFAVVAIAVIAVGGLMVAVALTKAAPRDWTGDRAVLSVAYLVFGAMVGPLAGLVWYLLRTGCRPAVVGWAVAGLLAVLAGALAVVAYALVRLGSGIDDVALLFAFILAAAWPALWTAIGLLKVHGFTRSRLGVPADPWLTWLPEHSMRVPQQLPNAPLQRAAVIGLMVLKWVAYVFAGVFILGALTGPFAGQGQSGPPLWNLLVAAFLLLIGAKLRSRINRRVAVSSTAVRAADPRAPVLFLRAFTDEQLAGGVQFLTSTSFRFEEKLVARLWHVGPVVAIGQPGEKWPQPGAAREYVDDQTWQHRIAELMREAALIVMVVGRTAGLAWELQHIREQEALRRLVIVLPPEKPQLLIARWRAFCARIGESLDERMIAAVDPESSLLLAFRGNGQPILLNARSRKPSFYGDAIALALWLTSRTAPTTTTGGA